MGSKRLDKSDSTLHSPKIPFVSANRSWDIVEDPELFLTAFDNLIVTAAKTAKGKHPHVGVFGECVHLLWAQGNAEAAIRMEKLGNQLTSSYDVDTPNNQRRRTGQDEKYIRLSLIYIDLQAPWP